MWVLLVICFALLILEVTNSGKSIWRILPKSASLMLPPFTVVHFKGWLLIARNCEITVLCIFIRYKTTAKVFANAENKSQLFMMYFNWLRCGNFHITWLLTCLALPWSFALDVRLRLGLKTCLWLALVWVLLSALQLFSA